MSKRWLFVMRTIPNVVVMRTIPTALDLTCLSLFYFEIENTSELVQQKLPYLKNKATNTRNRPVQNHQIFLNPFK